MTHCTKNDNKKEVIILVEINSLFENEGRGYPSIYTSVAKQSIIEKL
jgi:hypothetical protein